MRLNAGAKREIAQSPMSDVAEEPMIPVGISMELNSMVMRRVTGLTDGEIANMIGKVVRGIDISEI